MSNHHRDRRTTVPPPAPVEFAPPVTDPKRSEWVRRAYAEVGHRLLEWRQQFGLTPADLLAVMHRCGIEHLESVVRTEREDKREEPLGLGGSPDLEPKPQK